MTTQHQADYDALGSGGHERWALILTGGGNRGAIQAGAALALFETGFVPDLIVGVSAGALNGAYLASFPSIEGAERLTAIWRRVDGRRLFGTRFPRARTVAALLLGRRSAYTNSGLRSLLETELPSTRFEDTAVPLAVTATHLESGTARTLASGDMIRAVLASAAVPAHLPPVMVDGEWLIDGAIADPVPLHIPAGRGIDRIVVIEPGYACACSRVYESALSIMQQSVAVLARRCMDTELGTARHDLDIIHVGLSCHADLPLTDLSQTETMVASGYGEASSVLRSLGPLPWAGARFSSPNPGSGLDIGVSA